MNNSRLKSVELLQILWHIFMRAYYYILVAFFADICFEFNIVILIYFPQQKTITFLKDPETPSPPTAKNLLGHLAESSNQQIAVLVVGSMLVLLFIFVLSMVVLLRVSFACKSSSTTPLPTSGGPTSGSRLMAIQLVAADYRKIRWPNFFLLFKFF